MKRTNSILAIMQTQTLLDAVRSVFGGEYAAGYVHELLGGRRRPEMETTTRCLTNNFGAASSVVNVGPWGSYSRRFYKFIRVGDLKEIGLLVHRAATAADKCAKQKV
jgi:hypothetical protein